MKKNSKSKIAKVYSTALYEAAAEKGVIGKVWEDVDKLRAFLQRDKEFALYLASPLWSEEDKEDVLAKTSKILKLDDDTKTCLEIISQNRRMSDLAAILDEFVEVCYRKNNIAEVEVETVKELSAAQDEKLCNVLQKLLGRKIVVKYNLNPLVLGGLRIKCGSQMYDDCLATKLNYLENVMKGK